MATGAYPGYFGSEGAECFGWLHLPPDGLRTDMGLVICSPLGHEDQSAYRSLRQLAIAAAARGVPTLRFDYLGCGDSLGADGTHDHPDGWRRSVDTAIDTLIAKTGVARVCLLGVRLGALAAAQAAEERHDVAAFVALVPVLRGRAFLREALLRSPQVPANESDGFETGGHLITARARAELSAIDLHTAARAPAAHVLLAAPSEGADHTRWRARLQSQGARTEFIEAPELGPMVQSDVTVVGDLVERLATWIGRHAGPARAAAPRGVGGSWNHTVQAEGVRETTLSLQAGGLELFALLAEPPTGSVRRAVLLLNTGSARRIGASRAHVGWARRWARAGLAVLRIDLPGLGDSADPPGVRAGEAYGIDSAPAIEAGLALLRARHGRVDCTLLGTCSGAYHALRAAVGGARIESLVLINQATYHWAPDVLENPSLLMRLSWRRYARRNAMFIDRTERPVARLRREFKWHLIEALVATRAAVRDLARLAGLPMPGDMGADFHTLADRGVGLHILMSELDDAEPLLQLEAGRAVATLRGRGQMTLEVIAGADHIFTSQAARDRLGTSLDRIVYGGTGQVRSLQPAVKGSESVAWGAGASRY